MSNEIELQPTGERYLPGMGGRIAAEHLNRYAFATKFVSQKIVLDIASGEGYGSAIMAQNALFVHGVDVAEDAVGFSLKKYAGISNLTYHLGDINSLNFDDGTFDVITCFETIEHVSDSIAAAGELKRVLKQDGVLIVSTPNKAVYTERFGYNNPFHTHELEFQEFRMTLQALFSHVKFYGQFSGTASLIDEIGTDGTSIVSDTEISVAHSSVPRWTNQQIGDRVEPLYFLAVCSDIDREVDISPVEFFDRSDWRSIEDEFLFREIRASESTSSLLVTKLLEQIDMVRLMRSNLSNAHAKLARLEKQAIIDRGSEANVIRSAFKMMQLEYHSLAERFGELQNTLAEAENRADQATFERRVIESSTIWRLSAFFRILGGKMPALRKIFRSTFRKV